MKHTNRLTLKCAFCKGNFTAPIGERMAASTRHIQACEKAGKHIARWYGADAERIARNLSGIANTYVTGREIMGVFKSTVKCDSRCEGATRHVCECSCGGKNHGSALAA